MLGKSLFSKNLIEAELNGIFAGKYSKQKRSEEQIKMPELAPDSVYQDQLSPFSHEKCHLK